VRARHVVKADPRSDAGFDFGHCLVGVQIDLLVFQRSPQTLDEDVVHPSALAIHADVDLGIEQHGGEGLAGELAALIGIEDLRLAIAVQGFAKSVDTAIGVQAGRELPTQHVAAEPIQ